MLRFLIASREEVGSEQLRDDLLSMLVGSAQLPAALCLAAVEAAWRRAAHLVVPWVADAPKPEEPGSLPCSTLLMLLTAADAGGGT